MQKVGSGVVAVAIEEDAIRYNEILRMNTSGAFIFEKLKYDISYAKIVELMIQKYNADKTTVEKILVDFLSMLSGKELLVDDKGKLIKKIDIQEKPFLY
jgi:hypothetical protein